jgi:hypothetical protein
LHFFLSRGPHLLGMLRRLSFPNFVSSLADLPELFLRRRLLLWRLPLRAIRMIDFMHYAHLLEMGSFVR